MCLLVFSCVNKYFCSLRRQTKHDNDDDDDDDDDDGAQYLVQITEASDQHTTTNLQNTYNIYG